MDDKKEKPSWYSLHKEQVKLIQFLLYHLRKNKEKPEKKESVVKFEQKEITVTFD